MKKLSATSWSHYPTSFSAQKCKNCLSNLRRFQRQNATSVFPTDLSQTSNINRIPDRYARSAHYSPIKSHLHRRSLPRAKGAIFGRFFSQATLLTLLSPTLKTACVPSPMANKVRTTTFGGDGRGLRSKEEKSPERKGRRRTNTNSLDTSVHLLNVGFH